jgi:hypothetical protein
MLDNADKVNLGVDARIELWKAIDLGSVGPVIIDEDE